MYKTAIVAAVAMAGHMTAEAYKLQKRDGAGGHHDHGHSAAAPVSSGYEEPSAGYSAPASSYGAPAASYGAPAASYGAPAPSYGAPAPSYGAAAPSYGVTGYGVEDEAALPDLTPIIIGILALVGLSLLFPTFVSLTSVRRKRDAAEDANPMVDMAERVNDIYNSVIQSEECMERIACEIGGLAKDVGLTASPAVSMADAFVPSKYKGYFKQFKSGSNCHKIKCGGLSF